MNYLFAKFLEILTTGLLDFGKFVQEQSISIFWATAHALHLTGFFRFEKSENCWVLCIVTFSNIPLLQKTKAISVLRTITKKIGGIEQIKWSLYKRHVCFCNPCARAESHQHERVRKLCSATLKSQHCEACEERSPHKHAPFFAPKNATLMTLFRRDVSDWLLFARETSNLNGNQSEELHGPLLNNVISVEFSGPVSPARKQLSLWENVYFLNWACEKTSIFFLDRWVGEVLPDLKTVK